MKKLLILIVTLFLFNSVSAESIDSINMKIYIDKDGSAIVTEEWKVDLDSGTELYKSYDNLGKSNITEFEVRDSVKKYTEKKSWNVNANFNEKSYKYGINKNGTKTELCWGISRYGSNTYYLSYKITNFVENMNKDIGVYFGLIPKNIEPNVEKVNIIIESFYQLNEKNTKIESFGFDGTNTINDGRITIGTNKKFNKNNYVVILLKLDSSKFDKLEIVNPLNYEQILTQAKNEMKLFNKIKENFYNLFNTNEFQTIMNVIKKGLYYLFILAIIITFINPYFFILLFKPLITGTYRHIKDIFKQRKVIKENFENYNRNLPFNGDMLKIYYVGVESNIIINKFNIINGYLLKWYYKGNIDIDKKYIYFEKMPTDDLEIRLYNILKSIKEQRKIKIKKIKKDLKDRYGLYQVWNELLLCRLNLKYGIVSEDEIKELVEFRQFIKHFSNLDLRNMNEIKIWEGYLLIANILGVTKNIDKQIKKRKNLDIKIINAYNEPIRMTVNRFYMAAVRESILVKFSRVDRTDLFSIDDSSTGDGFSTRSHNSGGTSSRGFSSGGGRR